MWTPFSSANLQTQLRSDYKVWGLDRSQYNMMAVVQSVYNRPAQLVVQSVRLRLPQENHFGRLYIDAGVAAVTVQPCTCKAFTTRTAVWEGKADIVVHTVWSTSHDH
jgi:hypothetical protein